MENNILDDGFVPKYISKTSYFIRLFCIHLSIYLPISIAVIFLLNRNKVEILIKIMVVIIIALLATITTIDSSYAKYLKKVNSKDGK
jgi:hypothetical protein